MSPLRQTRPIRATRATPVIPPTRPCRVQLQRMATHRATAIATRELPRVSMTPSQPMRVRVAVSARFAAGALVRTVKD
jgi:hypothetical protein